MSNAGKRTLSFAAALICIVLYTAALIFGVGRILVDYNNRRVLVENEFNEILDRSSGAAILGFMSREYQRVIQDTIDESETLLGVIISGSNGAFGFERQPGTVIGDDLRFKTGFDISKEPLYKGIYIEGQRNTTIRAIYSYLDYNKLVQVLKDSLFIILLIVAFAVLVLILEINFRAKQSRTAPAPGLRQAGVSSPVVQRPAPDTWEEEVDDEDDESPKGLFSPRGIGWESYTAERLDSELHRCATLEEDLVLIAMDSRKNRFDEETIKKLIIEIIRFFTQRDMIFEKGEQGLTLIIPALNLEQGFTKSEQFRSRINDSLIDSSGHSLELCIGLSSRAGRLVEAERLILEASQALVKAVNDPDSPIVAFKSDPEKYRNFISKRRK
jgi:hypothetical protein